MRLQVKGRNLEVSEQIRKYAEDKLGKLDRLVSDPTRGTPSGLTLALP